MRLRMIVALVATLCASCSARDVGKSSFDWLKPDWGWQRHVLESREAWDNATGQKNQYEEAGIQLAR